MAQVTREVETEYGWIRGDESAGIHSFKGVPFAGSPSGAHRFLPPTPPEPWTGVRDATRPGIYAYTPDGEEKGYIPTSIPTNVHFGRGEQSNYLYITADNSLYGMRVGKRGHHLQ